MTSGTSLAWTGTDVGESFDATTEEFGGWKSEYERQLLRLTCFQKYFVVANFWFAVEQAAVRM